MYNKNVNGKLYSYKLYIHDENIQVTIHVMINVIFLFKIPKMYDNW